MYIHVHYRYSTHGYIWLVLLSQNFTLAPVFKWSLGASSGWVWLCKTICSTHYALKIDTHTQKNKYHIYSTYSTYMSKCALFTYVYIEHIQYTHTHTVYTSYKMTEKF